MDNQLITNANPENILDIDRVIATKSKNLHKFLPRFVTQYLKRIIHQNELNEIVRTNKHLEGIDFLEACLKGFGVKVRFQGIENLSQNERWIVAANHPLGGLDGIALMWVVGQIRTDIIFPVNDILLHIPNLRKLFIPINKHGSNSQNVRVLDQAFASNQGMLYFPAGLCSRKKNGKIEDLEWKKSFISKARTHQRDVIPCYISGRNSNWFYNLANFRSFLKIKTNFEMLYLVDEMYRQKNKEIIITFGEKIPFKGFDKSKTDLEWAKQLKKHVYSLKNNQESRFQFGEFLSK